MHDAQQSPATPWTQEVWLAAIDEARRQRRLSQGPVWVAQALLRLMPEGAGSATLEEIADVAGLTRKSTSGAITRLIDCGLLTRTSRKPPAPSNSYTLATPPERQP